MGPYDYTDEIEQAITELGEFRTFLAVAPTLFGAEDLIHKYHLSSGEFISCIRWNGIFYISGTDVVNSIAYWFEAFGRRIDNRKKFEEGVFSDLRSLRVGTDSLLEPSKSPLLTFMQQNRCIRTRKKQKVFFWYAVRYDLLFIDALERDIRKEQNYSLEEREKPTTSAVREPATSFNLNSKSFYTGQEKKFSIDDKSFLQSQPHTVSSCRDAAPSQHLPPMVLPPLCNRSNTSESPLSEPKTIPCLLDADEESEVEPEDLDESTETSEVLTTPSTPKNPNNDPLINSIPSSWRRNHRPNEFPENASYL